MEKLDEIAAMRARVQEVVSDLDPENPEHWTQDGKPDLALVNKLAKTRLNRPALDEITSCTRDMQRRVEEREMDELLGNAGVPATPSPEAGALDIKTPEQRAEAGESVLDMPIQHVLASPDLVRRARVEIDARMQALLAERKALDERLEKLSRASALVDRVLTTLEPPQETLQQQIKAVQKRAQESRWERSKAARRFVDAGTTPQDVIKALDPRAQIDRALNGHRGGPGSKRPTPHLLGSGS